MRHNNKLLIIIGIILLIIFLAYLSASLYQILALSMIIAYFVHPLKKKIMKLIKNENFASLLAMLSGFLILSSIILILLLSIYNSASGIKSLLAKNPDIELAFLSITLFKNINIIELLTATGINQLFNMIQLMILIIPSLAVNALIFFLFLFYFIKYGQDIAALIKGLIPPGEIKNFETFSSKLNNVMKSIFQAQFITAFVETALIFVFLSILGIPLAFELSLLTFMLGFLSITTILVPIGINIYHFYLATLTGNFSIFFITIAFSLFIFVIDDFIKPLISKKIAKTNPALFLLGIFGGITTLGFTGFIIGPVITSSLKIIFEILYPPKKSLQ
ncbi:MAG: AI-2E family transporter [Candidatus Nanoarchaeia archaeon]|nr:AI-2E family transporter [Candidatus Nanoarchaeia archaeon]MDD5054572.1 AI-2E family transporter [Candidatus Nanoarchaeia archaeon]MDD5499728.1 AI-2E family transporter [Candidatus Nanoarchaeia archaeon]